MVKILHSYIFELVKFWKIPIFVFEIFIFIFKKTTFHPMQWGNRKIYVCRDYAGKGRFNGYSFKKLLFPGAVSLFERWVQRELNDLLEDQALSPSYDWLFLNPSHILPSEARQATHRKSEKERNLADGRGGERLWGKSQTIRRRESLALCIDWLIWTDPDFLSRMWAGLHIFKTFYAVFSYIKW